MSQDRTEGGPAGAAEPAGGTPEPADDPWTRAGLPSVQPAPRHEEPYRTVAVLAVAAGVVVVPVLSLLGHRRLSIIWLGVGVLMLALVRLQRPRGTWIAARGRWFDVVFGVLLAVALFALASYADLPRVV